MDTVYTGYEFPPLHLSLEELDALQLAVSILLRVILNTDDQYLPVQ